MFDNKVASTSLHPRELSRADLVGGLGRSPARAELDDMKSGCARSARRDRRAVHGLDYPGLVRRHQRADRLSKGGGARGGFITRHTRALLKAKGRLARGRALEIAAAPTSPCISPTTDSRSQGDGSQPRLHRPGRAEPRPGMDVTRCYPTSTAARGPTSGFPGGRWIGGPERLAVILDSPKETRPPRQRCRRSIRWAHRRGDG